MNDKIKKIIIKTRQKKLFESTRINSLNTIFGLWGRNNTIESKQSKSWSLISNQPSIKEWNNHEV